MINFTKMNGNGNDFVVINSIKSEVVISEELIKRISCRKNGIGFDQLILISPPKNPTNHFLITFFNSDGGKALMCLNGIRCASSYLWLNKFAPKKEMLLETENQVSRVKPMKDHYVEVVINSPRNFKNSNLLSSLSKQIDKPFSLVDSGNLHLCVEVGSFNEINLDDIYKKTESLIKPYQINVSTYIKGSKEIEISTYENGVGRTLSCGSASASVAFLNLNNNDSLKVTSEGGTLNFLKADGKLIMTGPTKLDFNGVINE